VPLLSSVGPELATACVSPSSTFKFKVDSFGHRLKQSEQFSVMERLNFMTIPGTVNLSNPDVRIALLETYRNGGVAGKKPKLSAVFVGREVSHGARRGLHDLSLKAREYIGTTSMAADCAFFTANQALAAPGKVVFDPFVGTGSLIVAAAYFGATVMGADIDSRTLWPEVRGGIYANFKQYRLTSQLGGIIHSDFAQCPFPDRPIFDAIVADPPYGVREGARKVGTLVETALPRKPGARIMTVPYRVSDILKDLLEFAARRLYVGGRLVFWMPCIRCVCLWSHR
jgi:tRNA (guanine10-N2)-methyltransferase